MRIRLILFSLFSILMSADILSANDSFDASYLGNYPDEAEVIWADELQGVTHDSDDWFITQRYYLWKIPVAYDLADDIAFCTCYGNDCEGRKLWACYDMEDPPYYYCAYVCSPGVFWQNQMEPAYDHYGGNDYFEYQGQGYVLIAVQDGDGGTNKPAILQIFRSNDNLDYVGYAVLGAGGSWVTVDPSGYIYTGDGTSLAKFRLDWKMLHEQSIVSLERVNDLNIFNESGDPLSIPIQGGVFSEQGDLLYTLGGSVEGHIPEDGINVIDVQTGHRVAKSINQDTLGEFSYAFSPGWDNYEEPEGLTVWDLSDGRAPGIRGQLHALLLDNDFWADDVWIKHYDLQEPTIHQWNLHDEEVQEGISRIYRATDTVTAAEYIVQPGGSVNFSAGNQIHLQQGFHAQRGSHFQAKIE